MIKELHTILHITATDLTFHTVLTCTCGNVFQKLSDLSCAASFLTLIALRCSTTKPANRGVPLKLSSEKQEHPRNICRPKPTYNSTHHTPQHRHITFIVKGPREELQLWQTLYCNSAFGSWFYTNLRFPDFIPGSSESMAWVHSVGLLCALYFLWCQLVWWFVFVHDVHNELLTLTEPKLNKQYINSVFRVFYPKVC